MNFFEKLKKISQKNQSLLCVGLDSQFERLPSFLKKKNSPLYLFNKQIIDHTFDLVCAYKLNLGFYLKLGSFGIKQLELTSLYLKKQFPNIPFIIDGKFADIGNTSKEYADFVFSHLKADAVTLNPYLGKDALEPFLNQKEKGLFILCKTSNPGSDEFQNLFIKDKIPFYQKIAYQVVNFWNENKNCGLVVGANYPLQLKKIRQLAENLWILVPGIGPQGGDLEEVLKNGLTKAKDGLIINVSRQIIFASGEKDFGKKARQKAKEIHFLIKSFTPRG